MYFSINCTIKTNCMNNLTINVFSISTDIKIVINNDDDDEKYEDKIFDRNDTFSFSIEKQNLEKVKIFITSSNEDYGNIDCPIIINSIINKPDLELKVDEENPVVLYFNEDLEKIKLFYELKDFNSK